MLQLSLPFSIESYPTLFLLISLTFALGHLFQLYLTETFVTLLLFVSPVLNLPSSCPPLCILLALLLTIRVRSGLNYSFLLYHAFHHHNLHLSITLTPRT